MVFWRKSHANSYLDCAGRGRASTYIRSYAGAESQSESAVPVHSVVQCSLLNAYIVSQRPSAVIQITRYGSRHGRENGALDSVVTLGWEQDSHGVRGGYQEA